MALSGLLRFTLLLAGVALVCAGTLYDPGDPDHRDYRDYNSQNDWRWTKFGVKLTVGVGMTTGILKMLLGDSEEEEDD